MKCFNYFFSDTKWILFGFCCSIVILVVGACEGIEVDANEIAGVLSTTTYLLARIYPSERKNLEAVLMPMTVAALSLVFGLGWMAWLLVFSLVFYHLYFIENARGPILLLDTLSVVATSLVYCGLSHLFYWLISLI